MRVEVKLVHLVAIFAKVISAHRVGKFFAPKTFPTFRLLCNCNLNIYIAVLLGLMVFLVV